MKDKILKEITTHCKECHVKECCPEHECVLYRIQELILKKKCCNEK